MSLYTCFDWFEKLRLFSYLKGKKTPSKLSFWGRHFHSKKPSDCRILYLDFQTPIANSGVLKIDPDRCPESDVTLTRQK
jgi:hypothetical protein